MGMSTHIIGFRAPDEEWQKMKSVWDACKAAEIDPPDDVHDFFDGGSPSEHGMEIVLPTQKWTDRSSKGIEIAIADIPKAVTHIRFYNSW